MKKRNEKKQAIPKDRDPLHPEKKLVTRRDFLSSGLLGFSGMAMIPTALEMTLFARAARAGECPGMTSASSMPPLLIFDCAGGAALPGNWPPMDQGGNPLPSYSALGLQSVNSFTLDARFGAPMAAPLPPPLTSTVSSQIFAQLAMLPPAIQSCIQMGIIPANSMSDSQSNMFSPISLVTAAGSVGSMVQTGLGMTAAQSGGNSDAGSMNPANKPMQIASADSLAAALSYGPAFNSLPMKALDALATALLNLSGSQATKFNAMNSGQQFSQLMQAGYLKNTAYTAGVGGIDPRINAACQTIFGISPTSAGNNQTVVYATLALNAIMGNSGPAVLTFGGCDYHDGSQTTGDKKDTQIGMTMAQAIQLAYVNKKPLTWIVYTDGGIYSNPGTRNWQGDDNGHGLAIFGVMNPSGNLSAMPKTQVGFYNAGQVTDPSCTVGQDAQKVCHALFLNYLAVSGMAGQYSQLIACQDPRNTTLLTSLYSGSTTAMLNDLLLFPNAALT